jgi:UDP:flavonoid glycosyltransferase YjiC (YdhE family)
VSVLFVPAAVGRSHLTRLLLIARELRTRGVDAAFAYGGEHGDLLEGFARHPLADVEVRDFAADIFAAYTPEIMERAIADVTAAAEATGARALVFDLHPAAPIAAGEAGIPCASVTNADLTAGFDVAQAFSKRRARVATAIRTVQGRGAASGLRRVARAHGRRDLRSVFDFARGDATLLADLAEWAPSASLAAGERYVGPLAFDEPGPMPQPPGEARRLYVTIGNTGSRELLDLAIEAFAGDPAYELAISSGAYVDPPRTDGVIAERFLPGDALMRSSALAIHCGGSGTTYQALGAARATIVVPFSAGQRVNAQLTAHHRVGVAYEPRKLDAERLRAGVRHVLATPGYTVAAARFARRLREIDAPAAAAEAVIELL